MALPHYLKFLYHSSVKSEHFLGLYSLLNLFESYGWLLPEFDFGSFNISNFQQFTVLVACQNLILTWLKQRMKSQHTHHLVFKIWGLIQIYQRWHISKIQNSIKYQLWIINFHKKVKNKRISTNWIVSLQNKPNYIKN